MNSIKINFENNCKIEYELGEDILVENGYMRVNKSPYRLKCPLDLDNDFAYLVGYHLGDGYLEDVNKTFKRRGKAGYEAVYADRDINQIKLIGSIILDKFGFNLKIYKKPDINLWIGRANSCKVLHWFLNTKLGLPLGKRYNIEIPKWILSNNMLLSNFISGFFDADGDVHETANHSYKIIRIQLTQKDKEILHQLKDLLYTKFSIKSNISKKWNQNAWMLHIWGRKNAIVFKEKIDFRNVIKKQRLEEYLKSKNAS